MNEFSFRYSFGGILTPIENPTAAVGGDVDLRRRLSVIGYDIAGTLGQEEGLSMEIYHSQASSIQRWILSPSDSSVYCLIEVEGWQDYLDALARYSPIYGISLV